MSHVHVCPESVLVKHQPTKIREKVSIFNWESLQEMTGGSSREKPAE